MLAVLNPQIYRYHPSGATRRVDMLMKISRLQKMDKALLVNWEKKSRERQKLYKQVLAQSAKAKLYNDLPAYHEEAFEQIDCLQCAACCKNYSPRFKTTDIKRIAKKLRLKESVFIDNDLRLDEDGDYVVKSTPCPFLESDHRCGIYDDRPSDCARFPYTDEDVLVKRPQLTLKNSSFCPAVYYVLEKMIANK